MMDLLMVGFGAFIAGIACGAWLESSYRTSTVRCCADECECWEPTEVLD